MNNGLPETTATYAKGNPFDAWDGCLPSLDVEYVIAKVHQRLMRSGMQDGMKQPARQDDMIRTVLGP